MFLLPSFSIIDYKQLLKNRVQILTHSYSNTNYINEEITWHSYSLDFFIYPNLYQIRHVFKIQISLKQFIKNNYLLIWKYKYSVGSNCLENWIWLQKNNFTNLVLAFGKVYCPDTETNLSKVMKVMKYYFKCPHFSMTGYYYFCWHAFYKV